MDQDWRIFRSQFNISCHFHGQQTCFNDYLNFSQISYDTIQERLLQSLKTHINNLNSYFSRKTQKETSKTFSKKHTFSWIFLRKQSKMHFLFNYKVNFVDIYIYFIYRLEIYLDLKDV